MSRCHTFLFADLVGFTAFTERHGDDAAADVAIRFAEAAGELAHDHGVRLVKCLGDGVMLRGDDAARVVRLGLLLQSELAGLDGLPPIHAGAHTGCAVERRGDWFGAAVNLAARVSDAARGGELLLTQATVAAAGHLRGVDLDELGPQLFRNVGAAVEVYSARPAVPEPAGHGLELPWARRPVLAPAAA
jgi:adenylate cyclase